MQSYRTAQQAVGVIFEKYNLVYFSNAVEEFKEDALKKDAFLEIVENYSRDNERMRDEINEFFATKLRRTKTMTREDLLQANAELTEEEIQALLGDQAKRSTKSAETERKRAEKKAETERKRAEKKAETDRKKAEKKAETDRKKAEKKAETDRKKAEKKAETDRKKAEKTGKAGKNPAVNIVLESFAREEVKEVKGMNVMDMLEEVEFDFEDEIDVQKKEENEQKTEEKAPKEKEKVPRKAKEERVPKEKKEKAPRKAKEEKVPKAKEEKGKREKLPRKAKEAKEEVGQYVLTETEEYTMIEDTRTKTSYFLRDNKCFTEDRLVGKWCEDYIEFHNLKSDEVKKMTFKDILVDGDNLGQRTCYIDGNCVVYLNAAGDIWGTYCPKTNTIKEFIEEGDDCDVDCDEDAATQEPDEHPATQEPDEHPATQEPDDEDAVSQESQGANKTQHEEDYI